MNKMKIAIVTLLALAFFSPMLMAQENRTLWSESNYIQSAKIHYQHVYKKSRQRDDLYHCIDLIREAADRFGHRPELYYMLGTFYAEINATDTMVAYYDSVTTFCDDESIDEKYRKNCYKKDNYIKQMGKLRQKYWEEAYNDAVENLNVYDTIAVWLKNAPSEDSAHVLDSMKNLAYSISKSSFESALMLKPEDPRNFDGLAVLLERENHHQDAIDLYTKAMEVQGESPALISKIAYAYIYIPDWKNSILWFEKYLEKEPNDINAMINLSVAYSNLDDHEKWYEYTSRVLELQPDNTQFLFNAGQYWFMKMQEAASQLTEVTDDTPDAATKRTTLDARILECRENAEKNFEDIIRINPEDTDALKRVGIIYLLSQQDRKAADAFESFLAIDATDKDVLDYLGRAYIKLEDTKAAIRPYEMLLELDPGDADAWERLSELYRYNGMQDKADEAKAKADELKKI